MANTTNYNWETPDDTDLVKDGAAAIRTLGSSVDTTTKALNPSTTLGDIEYRSATANTNTRLPIGTTGQILSVVAGVPSWVANDVGDITEVAAGTGITGGGTSGSVTITNSMATAIDAKGDLIGGTGADTFARLAVGANDTVLTADSTAATGLKWATPASGGGMTLIQEQTASASSSINFTSIAGTYKQLLLVVSGIYHSGNGSQFSIRFNNSSAVEYTCSGEGTNGTLAGTYGRIVAPQPYLGEDTTSTTPDDTVKASLLIDNYASSTKFKYFQGSTSFNFGGDQFHNVNGFWGNTAAITSVDIVRLSGAATITNLANTSIRLYGIS
jgi:hypothetical protein